MEIPYQSIGEGIRDVLSAALRPQYLGGIKIEVNPPEVGLSNTPEIGIYLAREEPNEVEIGSADPYETSLRWLILCGVTKETMQEANKAIYDLANRVKVALQADRSLGGTVETSTRGEIEFESVKNAGFWSAANITLNARLMA